MPELSEATIPEVVNELLGRETFDGAVIVADLGELSALDRAAAYFSNSLADSPLWRNLELLTDAKQRRERGIIPEPLS